MNIREKKFYSGNDNFLAETIGDYYRKQSKNNWSITFWLIIGVYFFYTFLLMIAKYSNGGVFPVIEAFGWIFSKSEFIANLKHTDSIFYHITTYIMVIIFYIPILAILGQLFFLIQSIAGTLRSDFSIEELLEIHKNLTSDLKQFSSENYSLEIPETEKMLSTLEKEHAGDGVELKNLQAKLETSGYTKKEFNELEENHAEIKLKMMDKRNRIISLKQKLRVLKADSQTKEKLMEQTEIIKTSLNNFRAEKDLPALIS